MKTNLKTNLNFKRGMTLVEIAVVIGIMLTVLISVVSFQRNIFIYNQYTQDTLSSAQDARAIIGTMVKEIRTATPGNNGAYPIQQAAIDAVSFFSDSDSDGLKEQIRYFLSGTTLKKGSIKPTGSPSVYLSTNEVFSTLAYSVKNSSTTPLFEYYDSTFAGTSSPLVQPVVVNKVRLIKVSLIIDTDPNRSPIPRTFTSVVNIRNLKDNL